MSITGNIQANGNWLEIKDGGARGEAQDQVPSTVANAIQAFTAGTGSGQINGVYRIPYTIASAATQNLTISSALTDELGGTFGFAEIKGLLIKNLSSSLASVLFSIADSVSTKDEFAATIPPGASSAPLMSPTAYTIIVAQNDVLEFINQAGGDANIEVYIWGVKV